MNRQELIELAQECGWEWRPNSAELVRGYYTIFLSHRHPEKIILTYWETRTKYEQIYTNLHSVEYKPWIIGPFEDGWFSLKANRWCK